MGETTQTLINLDEISDESHVSVQINGEQYQATEPTLAMLENLEKVDKSSDSNIEIMRDFIRSVLPSLPDDVIRGLTMKKASVLCERVCEELVQDPTEAAPEA